LESTLSRQLALLTARSVSKQRGDTVILDRVSLSIGPGRRIGVVGANGAGKTTLLRMLAGLDLPDAGVIERAPATTTVGYLPQEPVARAGETLLDYLRRRTGVAKASAALEAASQALGVGLAGADDDYAEALDRYLALGAADLDARAALVCAEHGLDESLLGVEMASLSGGQRARAALAGVVLARFDVLLLDEPTNDLDFSGLSALESFLPGVSGGIVVVSHDRAFLERTVNSVLEIDEHSRRAVEHRGGWLAYLEERATARRHASEAYEGYSAERKRLLERIREQRRWAVQGVKRAKTRPDDNDKNIRAFKIETLQRLAAKVRTSERAIERLESDRPEKPWEGWQLRLELPALDKASEVAAYLEGAVIERGGFRLGPVDLEVRWRERIGIVGANGSGKTSLLAAPFRSDTGCVRPTRCRARHGGRRARPSETADLRVGAAVADLLGRD
jgi:ATPase subunit of ABC transporter with duplicated ATPase domains